MPYGHDFTLQLAASSTAGIAATQSGTASGGTSLLINGGLASGGVATLDVPRRVAVYSAGNDASNSFSITGTDYFGRLQKETVTGGSGTTVATLRDFALVTSVIPSTNTAGNVAVGTNGVGSTIPWVVDQWANPNNYGVGIKITGAANYNIESAYDNLYPNWDVNANVPTWNAAVGIGNVIQGPLTMLRLTINSGTGSVTAMVRQSYAGHG